MKRVAFLVNQIEEFDIEALTSRYLAGVKVDVLDSLPADSDVYNLIIPWNFRRIIKNVSALNNVIVFHSTDLPEGRGWAPVYYTLAKGIEYFTVTAFRPDEMIDHGEIVAKARFRIQPDHTAPWLRSWSREIGVMMAAQILDKFSHGQIRGQAQRGQGSTYARRRPEENEVQISATLESLVPHLRACEASHPAFFLLEGKKYLIRIEPEIAPHFPDDLEVNFPTLSSEDESHD
jgi:methionyl-tRNA formyltransferase